MNGNSKRPAWHKPTKILIIVLVCYVGLVVIFESSLGYFQPGAESQLVITATKASGERHRRVLTPVRVDGELYIAVNHWPRAWYRHVLARPNVHITVDGESGDYLAEFLKGAEHKRILAANNPGFLFRLLTGFPPRYFFHLVPQ